ncbi:ABC transporter permease [Actinokineospora fastidiosa]|uniref:Exporter of polyketide antibiotics n=1 Tax=Actinokineospora fastidiosa TaxID=1816 RepID=A0A918G3S7_9PSEU|nr:ABC transporter permease [Actinokineospora fastidiosa]GGS17610.1 exporter of polyketide antibiotics [Actinokineospora fastidiosa]
MTGTWSLIRLALRRDRVILPIWIVLLGLIPMSGITAYEELFPDEASRAALSAGAGSNPAIAVLFGPAYDLTTAGGFTAWRFGMFTALFIALMAIFTVTRHTRAEEDSGRLELLGSAVVGRHAALTAALAVTSGAALVIGVLIGAGLTGAGVAAGPSFLFGMSIAGTGIAFAAVSAVTAQFTEYARSANGMATAVLGLTFLLRGVGDSTVSLTWLSWLSPLAWPQLAKPYVEDRWWVLVLPVATALVIGAVAYALTPRRDLGAGLLPQRLGPPSAAASLGGPLGLAARLQRGGLIGWAIGFAATSAIFGSIANGITDLFGSSGQMTEILTRMGGAQALVDSFLASMAGMFGILAAVYGVQAVLRMRAEETTVRAEPVLAAGASRLGWSGAHLVFALGGPALLLVLAGLGMGVGHGLRTDDLGTQVGHALEISLAQLPAVWIVAGAAALLFGVAPSVSVPGAWAVLAVVVLVTMFGPVLQVDQWVMDISPFSHVPKSWEAGPLLGLTAVAAVLLAAALTGFRRRDIG